MPVDPVVIPEAVDHYGRRVKVRARESDDYIERAFIAAIAAAIAIL